MQCPACRDATLIISERQNIEIDYCPQCRGVWLDRGELDKLIERSAAQAPTAPAAYERPQERDRKSTRLNSSHSQISYAVFCLKKKHILFVNGHGTFDQVKIDLQSIPAPTSGKNYYAWLDKVSDSEANAVLHWSLCTDHGAVHC